MDTPRQDMYVVVLLYESLSPEEAIGCYCEEFVLLFAESTERAEEKARREAESRSGSRPAESSNVGTRQVSWRLKHVVDAEAVLDHELVDGSLGDGSEVYSRYFKDYPHYRAFEPHLVD